MQKIGKSAFSSCVNLAAVHVDNIEYWLNIVFEDKYANPLTLAKKLYIGGEELTGEVAIPEGVKKINKFAFQNCSAITGVALPASVDSVGSDAFAGCDNIALVTIDDVNKWCNVELEDIYSSPFYLYDNMSSGNNKDINSLLYLDNRLVTSLEINDIDSVKSYVFAGCKSIKHVSIGHIFELM